MAASFLSVASIRGPSIPVSLFKGGKAACGQPALIVQETLAPSIAVVEESLVEARNFAESALVCRFNGFWPRLVDLHKWISEIWKPLVSEEISIYPFARGFFVVDFDSPEEKQIILDSGQWFWGISGLFMKPWSPLFDPTIDQIPSTPVWVQLPNLPLHLCKSASLEAIGNALGSFYDRSPETKDYIKTTFARICVEMDFNNGFPAEIHLISKDYVWVQKLDYENMMFRCRSCFATGHLVKDCPKASQIPKSKKLHRKSTWWDGANSKHYTKSRNEDLSEEALSQAKAKKEDPRHQQESTCSSRDSAIQQMDLKSPAPQDAPKDVVPIFEAYVKPSDWTKVGKKKKGASPSFKRKENLISPRKTRSQQTSNR